MTRRDLPVTRIVAIAAMVSIAGAFTSVAAQQRPDFNGVWVRSADSSGGRGAVAATGDAAFRRGDMGTGWGSPLTLTHTAQRLNVVFDFFIAYDLQPKARYAYALDGSESKNVVTVGHSDAPVRSRAEWKGDTLVITTKFTAPPEVDPALRTPEVRHALSLDPSGRLVIAVQRPDAGGVLNTVVSTYTKR
jgi:hypothetical protein